MEVILILEDFRHTGHGCGIIKFLLIFCYKIVVNNFLELKRNRWSRWCKNIKFYNRELIVATLNISIFQESADLRQIVSKAVFLKL